MRLQPYIFSALATLAITFAVFRLSYDFFRSEELSKAQGRLSLYQSSVLDEIERFSHLTYVLARDPLVLTVARDAAGAAANPATALLNARLDDFAQRAGLDAIYLMGTDGHTVAASNHRETNSFVGQNYGFRPYFSDALEGNQGRFYAIGATTGLPGYFIADPVRTPVGAVSGVIAIKIDLSKLEQNWRASGEQVLLANADGVVLLSSDPAWRYRVLQPLDATRRSIIDAARQFPGQTLPPLHWTDQGNQRATINGVDRLHLVSDPLPEAWRLHYFTADVRAVAQASLITALVALAAGAALIFAQIQRARRVGAALARSEKEEAALRLANDRLAREVEDRRTAERRLHRTQTELERASRLAALGQLSASVTHELGQPIAAMRNQLTAAEIAQETGAVQPPLIPRMSSLVDRMEGLTRQLKFFARSTPESFEELDLRDAMTAALSLVEPNLAELRPNVTLDISDQPVLVRGSRLRLEQVMTNILRNALDSLENSDAPTLSISVQTDGIVPWFEIRDTGHGLGQATLDELQEPFVSTRDSGRGMGLGLAISASIVKDHGATMTARNRPGGGAAFCVRFAPPSDP